MKPAETYTVTLRSLPGYTAPVIVRLRRFLKVALRAFGLRCVSIRKDHHAD